MKTTANKNKVFNGAGYLFGSVITIFLAIFMFIITENFVIAISSLVPVGITTGIILEQRFNKEPKNEYARLKGIKAGIFLLGILTLFSMLFISHWLLTDYISASLIK